MSCFRVPAYAKVARKVSLDEDSFQKYLPVAPLQTQPPQENRQQSIPTDQMLSYFLDNDYDGAECAPDGEVDGYGEEEEDVTQETRVPKGVKEVMEEMERLGMGCFRDNLPKGSTQCKRIPASEILDYSLDPDYETENEEQEMGETEIDDVIDDVFDFLGDTTEEQHEDCLFKPDQREIRNFERAQPLGITSTPRKERVALNDICKKADPIMEELDSMEELDVLEKAAIYQYLQSNDKKKYLFDGDNMIRLKPRKNAAFIAVVGKAYVIKRKLKERFGA